MPDEGMGKHCKATKLAKKRGRRRREGERGRAYIACCICSVAGEWQVKVLN